ncbi:LPXTG cell wall anchor domain-containing protein [Plantactinospora sp. CA-290183]
MDLVPVLTAAGTLMVVLGGIMVFRYRRRADES